MGLYYVFVLFCRLVWQCNQSGATDNALVAHRRRHFRLLTSLLFNFGKYRIWNIGKDQNVNLHFEGWRSMQPKTTALVSLNFSDSKWSFSWGLRPEKPHFRFWPKNTKNIFENNYRKWKFRFSCEFLHNKSYFESKKNKGSNAVDFGCNPWHIGWLEFPFWSFFEFWFCEIAYFQEIACFANISVRSERRCASTPTLVVLTGCRSVTGCLLGSPPAFGARTLRFGPVNHGSQWFSEDNGTVNLYERLILEEVYSRAVLVHTGRKFTEWVIRCDWSIALGGGSV